MKYALLLAVLALAACSSKPASPGNAPADLKPDMSYIEYINEERAPAQAAFTPEQMYAAYKWMIVTSTQLRQQAYKAGDIAKVCNASGSARNIDTMAYYMAFENLDNPDSKIGSKLQKELGFTMRNYVSLRTKRLPNKLHDACLSGSSPGVAKIAKNPAAVKAVMAQIESVMIEE